VVTTVVIGWVLRRTDEMRFHLNGVSTIQVGRWWNFCIVVLGPVVLTSMLVSRIVTLILDGYEEYAAWYLNVMGWGIVALFVVAALVLTRMRWRVDPDRFDAWPTYGGKS
jgi:NSS family neurotransmitter:Na+ symporter